MKSEAVKEAVSSRPRIDVYTDGACSGNPGPGGWGVHIVSPHYTKDMSGGAEHTTNNRMEMTAVIEALKYLPIEEKINIITDSKYVYDGVKAWLPGWLKNGFRNSRNKTILNRDLWEALNGLLTNRDMSWTWVKGHAENPGNEAADALATGAIKRG